MKEGEKENDAALIYQESMCRRAEVAAAGQLVRRTLHSFNSPSKFRHHRCSWRHINNDWWCKKESICIKKAEAQPKEDDDELPPTKAATKSRRKMCLPPMKLQRRAVERCARKMDAQTKLGKKECAWGMGRRSNFAAVKNARKSKRGTQTMQQWRMYQAKKEYKRCSKEGCTNQSQKGGVSFRHR